MSISTLQRPPAPQTHRIRQAPPTPPGIVDNARRWAVEWLSRHSLDILRVSLGVVFLAFGAQKFFPGVSPAEALAVDTVDALTFGIVAGPAALLLTAVMETFIGVTLITGRFLKLGLLTLGAAMVGILSPLVLFFSEMFPEGPPTLEAQYVFKDIVLVAAGLVVAAKALGAKLTHS